MADAPIPGDVTPELEIVYDIGSEHSPMDPFGRTILAIRGDGRLRLDNRHTGRKPRAWEGRVDLAVVKQLLGHLASATPPPGPMRLVPDEAVARIEVRSPGGTAHRSIPWHAGTRLPGYKEALEILDSLNHQVSGGKVNVAPNRLPPVVHDAAEAT